MSRLTTSCLIALLAISTMMPGAVPFPVGAAWAGDDDDDDDDDDDGIILRRIQPRIQPRAQPVRRAPAPVAAPLPQFRPEILTLDLSEADLDDLLGRGFTLIESSQVPVLGTVLRRLGPPPGMALSTARELVRGLPSGSTADYNHYYRTEGADVACEGPHCLALAQTGWPPASSRSAGCGPELRIGVIDAGINAEHETFNGARLTVRRESDPELRESAQLHGTSVAALLVGAPGGRSPGLVPDLPLVAIDAFHRDGSDERADAFALVRALGALADEQVRVANLSLAGPPNDVLKASIARLVAEHGMIVVAAAGNGGPNAAPAYPAAYEDVIAVTAVDQADRIYRRAGRGPHIDLAAPGVDLWTAASISGGRPKSGTSFAAPFVTAAAARLLQQSPELTPAEVTAALRQATQDLGAPGPDPIFGHGLLQVEAEGSCARIPGSAVTDSQG